MAARDFHFWRNWKQINYSGQEQLDTKLHRKVKTQQFARTEMLDRWDEFDSMIRTELFQPATRHTSLIEKSVIK